MAGVDTLLARKIGMTQVFNEDGQAIGVTVLEVGPCPVVQVKSTDVDKKTNKTDGYHAVQIAFGTKKEKNISNPVIGHYQKAGVDPKRYLREIRLTEPAEQKVGDVLKVDIFDGVQKIDVIGTSKGKGFAGGMKRWNFSGQRASHGNSASHRRHGGIGRQMSVHKGVPKGKKMAGQLGNERITQIGLEIFKVDAEKNLMLVKGTVPGANNSLVTVRKSLKEYAREDMERKAKGG